MKSPHFKLSKNRKEEEQLDSPSVGDFEDGGSGVFHDRELEMSPNSFEEIVSCDF